MFMTHEPSKDSVALAAKRCEFVRVTYTETVHDLDIIPRHFMK